MKKAVFLAARDQKQVAMMRFVTNILPLASVFLVSERAAFLLI